MLANVPSNLIVALDLAFKNWVIPFLRTAISETIPGLDLEISIHVTDAQERDNGDASSEKSSRVDAVLPSVDAQDTAIHASSPSTEKREPSDAAALAEMGGVALAPIKGRPNIPRIIQEEITNGAGPLAIEGESRMLFNRNPETYSHPFFRSFWACIFEQRCSQIGFALDRGNARRSAGRANCEFPCGDVQVLKCLLS